MNGFQLNAKKLRVKSNATIIKIGGYIDAVTSDALKRALDAVVKSRQFKIIVDLSDVEYIGSQGWSIFLNHLKHIRENNGDLKLVNMKPNVFEVFKVLEFFWFMKSYKTIDEAISDFNQHIPPMA
ncbi:STAS domain-containing protein [candidate division KSB1 bacterium]|nr:STAS domain-containing protein [candidate division KSB1 bacterium]NIR68765.1 STAS domain-containing protein [candidate division KSB1 bacterium]NIS25581.1 STAS domain-containing protein [candidate division KSB1 bacterium]NIT72475.1 STAS domain-containing protein [candidate division KSB1 bacterium]NIU26259.1 STAS domain-containing protein [candidate division KSB1 bacterium]